MSPLVGKWNDLYSSKHNIMLEMKLFFSVGIFKEVTSPAVLMKSFKSCQLTWNSTYLLPKRIGACDEG